MNPAIRTVKMTLVAFVDREQSYGGVTRHVEINAANVLAIRWLPYPFSLSIKDLSVQIEMVGGTRIWVGESIEMVRDRLCEAAKQ